ncbi:hypothetical protein ND925_13110 [Vibrio diabolicus]|nr:MULTISPECIES: hypothetical protein [Vibrio]MCR9556063.1 hypothetical protein [Vibrio sp. RM-41-2B]MCR9489566.1 hypothetical protein [Vibrio alginolyticus]MCR9514052.1 hypothetical protein [Vibrio alginolyticus]MCR9583658.1 hypothetical protein [Vibrio alginolyticus]MCS0160321.1 hypothetical protein [Vibrio alginolyticus]
MKKPSIKSNSRVVKNKRSSTNDNYNSIHKIRKKIEDILLEREEKKLWDL